MPWSTTSAMTQRLLFIRDFELGVFSFAALCARYGVSRETGYAVLARYRREGRYCSPLPVADDFGRYLLGWQPLLQPRGALVRPVLPRLFQDYGLPERIRTDNGAPFASCALARLSQLSVWLLRCGIHPELIEPGHPEQNPRHERMHRTLKAATTRPPAADHRAQQRCFNTFREEFNAERPHESLGMQPPATLYHPSPRAYRGPVEPLEYPGHFELRKVSRNGGIRWHKAWVNVSHVLAEEPVGFEAIADGLWDVYYRSVK